MPFLRILIKRYNSGSESTQFDNSYEVKNMDNSYESQPSSGRGSLSDTQFGAQSDDENANLAPLDHNNQYERNKYFTNHDDDDPQNNNILHGGSRFQAKSSQDAIFDGLTDSPSTAVDCTKMFQNDNVSPTTIDNILYRQSEIKYDEQPSHCSNQFSLELTFNGKIEKLCDALHKEPTLSQSEAIDSQNLPTLFKNTVDISRSFEPSLFLTKYTNEKSPDLFGDDDDDDDADIEDYNTNYPDDGNCNDGDTVGSEDGADTDSADADVNAAPDDGNSADCNNADGAGAHCVDSVCADVDDGADCAVGGGADLAPDGGADCADAGGADCAAYDRADCAVDDGADCAVDDGAECAADGADYTAGDGDDCAVGGGADRGDFVPDGGADCADAGGADCAIYDRADCAVDDGADCAVDDGGECAADGADCNAGVGDDCVVGAGRADCAPADGADCAVSEGADCAVDDGADCAINGGADCAADDHANCVVNDGADCAVNDGVDCTAGHGADCAVDDAADCAVDGADCVVNEGADRAVDDRAVCDVNEGGDCAVHNDADRAVDDRADCVVNDGADCAVDGSDCVVNEGADRAVDDRAVCVVNEGGDCAVDDDADCAVDDGAACAVNEGAECAVADGADYAVDISVDGADGYDEHDNNYISQNSTNIRTFPDQHISEADSMLTVQEFTESKDNSEHNGQQKNAQSISKHTDTNFLDEHTMDSSIYCTPIDDHRDQLLENRKREKELLKRIRKSLAGVPPPPTVTMPKIDLISAVLEHKEGILNFFKNDFCVENGDSCSTDSLFRPTHTLEETQTMAWKDMLSVRQHGLSFNLCKASENSEYLSLAIIDRFIGAETASSYQQSSPSSVKKRSLRLKMLTASPGSRLSHLARRRTVFSSANLAVNSKKLSSSLGPQILLDKKKCKNRRKGTPKRKTPASKRKNERKTPSSSMRKRLQNRNEFMKFGPSRETSRRALFQSPNKGKSLPKENDTLKESKIILKPDVAKRIEKSKRALFSSESFSTQNTPNTNSTGNEMDTASLYSSKMHPYSISFEHSSPSSVKLNNLFKRKRNAVEDNHDDNDAVDFSVEQNSKIFRGNSQILTPRALNIKSQSFCIGAGSSSQRNNYSDVNPCFPPSVSVRNVANGFSNSPNPMSSIGNTTIYKLARAQSENVSVMSNSLTENQRKKLLWAVSQALKEKKITAKHESFKEYAAVLARVVRRIFQEYYQKSSTSNSETMLRLAKKYVFNVITGRTADDIYFHAKAHIEEKKTRSENRLTGYITSEEYENRKIYLQQKTQKLSETISQNNWSSGSVQNLYTTENSLDSFSFSASQLSTASVTTSGCAILSQICSTRKIDSKSERQDHLHDSGIKNSLTQLPVIRQEQENFKQLSIQPNPTLQNSSSKNNICSSALRENIDNEQQKSAQKDFTGKDQRNMSPYIPSQRLGSAIKTHSNVVQDLFGTNIIKAKRQISFDN